VGWEFRDGDEIRVGWDCPLTAVARKRGCGYLRDESDYDRAAEWLGIHKDVATRIVIASDYDDVVTPYVQGHRKRLLKATGLKEDA